MNFFSPQFTFLLGLVISILFSINDDLQTKAKVLSAKLLQISVVLLGASLNFHAVMKQGAQGSVVTGVSIVIIIFLGWIGIKLLKIEKKLGWLLTIGTAICGGSAIGALAPVIAADSLAIGVSIGIVFILNGLAVYLFPWIGESLQLSQEQFGFWAALAIHDTSSVVAASSIYGEKALEVATTVKLTRALWIIPITLTAGVLVSSKVKKVSIPWFVIGFLVVSILFTLIAMPSTVATWAILLSRWGFAVTMFLIGINFNLQKIRTVGLRPLTFATLLWVIVSGCSLIWIMS